MFFKLIKIKSDRSTSVSGESDENTFSKIEKTLESYNENLDNDSGFASEVQTFLDVFENEDNVLGDYFEDRWAGMGTFGLFLDDRTLNTISFDERDKYAMRTSQDETSTLYGKPTESSNHSFIIGINLETISECSVSSPYPPADRYLLDDDEKISEKNEGIETFILPSTSRLAHNIEKIGTLPHNKKKTDTVEKREEQMAKETKPSIVLMGTEVIDDKTNEGSISSRKSRNRKNKKLVSEEEKSTDCGAQLKIISEERKEEVLITKEVPMKIQRHDITEKEEDPITKVLPVNTKSQEITNQEEEPIKKVSPMRINRHDIKKQEEELITKVLPVNTKSQEITNQEEERIKKVSPMRINRHDIKKQAEELITRVLPLNKKSQEITNQEEERIKKVSQMRKRLDVRKQGNELISRVLPIKIKRHDTKKQEEEPIMNVLLINTKGQDKKKQEERITEKFPIYTKSREIEKKDKNIMNRMMKKKMSSIKLPSLTRNRTKEKKESANEDEKSMVDDKIFLLKNDHKDENDKENKRKVSKKSIKISTTKDENSRKTESSANTPDNRKKLSRSTTKTKKEKLLKSLPSKVENNPMEDSSRHTSRTSSKKKKRSSKDDAGSKVENNPMEDSSRHTTRTSSKKKKRSSKDDGGVSHVDIKNPHRTYTTEHENSFESFDYDSINNDSITWQSTAAGVLDYLATLGDQTLSFLRMDDDDHTNFKNTGQRQRQQQQQQQQGCERDVGNNSRRHHHHHQNHHRSGNGSLSKSTRSSNTNSSRRHRQRSRRDDMLSSSYCSNSDNKIITAKKNSERGARKKKIYHSDGESLDSNGRISSNNRQDVKVVRVRVSRKNEKIKLLLVPTSDDEDTLLS